MHIHFGCLVYDIRLCWTVLSSQVQIIHGRRRSRKFAVLQMHFRYVHVNFLTLYAALLICQILRKFSDDHSQEMIHLLTFHHAKIVHQDELHLEKNYFRLQRCRIQQI